VCTTNFSYLYIGRQLGGGETCINNAFELALWTALGMSTHELTPSQLRMVHEGRVRGECMLASLLLISCVKFRDLNCNQTRTLLVTVSFSIPNSAGCFGISMPLSWTSRCRRALRTCGPSSAPKSDLMAPSVFQLRLNMDTICRKDCCTACLT
jgi:hypothetical protein